MIYVVYVVSRLSKIPIKLDLQNQQLVGMPYHSVYVYVELGCFTMGLFEAGMYLFRAYNGYFLLSPILDTPKYHIKLVVYPIVFPFISIIRSTISSGQIQIILRRTQLVTYIYTNAKVIYIYTYIIFTHKYIAH